MSGKAIITLLFALAVGSCSATYKPFYKYKGDGITKDNKPTDLRVNFGSRYIVDFGKIDLSMDLQKTVSFSGLPRANVWLIGFYIKDQEIKDTLNPLIEIDVTDKVAGTKQKYMKYLSKWGWMQSFAGGKPAQAFIFSRDIKITYNNSMNYEIRIKVIEPDPSAKHYDIHLVLQGSNYLGLF